jgi:hypothetical protein
MIHHALRWKNQLADSVAYRMACSKQLRFTRVVGLIWWSANHCLNHPRQCTGIADC